MRYDQWWRNMIVSVVCMVLFVFGVAAPVAAAPSLSVQATRRDPSGAVVFAPTITDRQGVIQPALAIPGEYIIVTGSGFPANAPVTASIYDGVKTTTLVPQDLNASVSAPSTPPMTDAMGGISGVAFRVPAAAQLADRQDTVAVMVAGVVTGALVNIDIPDPNATAGDKIVVGVAVAFYLVIGILFLILLRGLPTYPTLRTVSNRRANASS